MQKKTLRDEKSEQVEWIAVDKLIPYDKNPRAQTDESYQGLKASVEKWGMPQPIVANSTNNHIIGGHRRYRVAQELKWKKVPVIWRTLTPDQEEALNVTLNNPHIQGFFTDDIAEVLNRIKESVGEDHFKSLRFDALAVFHSWESDIERVDALPEVSDSAPLLLKVTIPREGGEAVRTKIVEFITKLNVEGIKIG